MDAVFASTGRISPLCLSRVPAFSQRCSIQGRGIPGSIGHERMDGGRDVSAGRAAVAVTCTVHQNDAGREVGKMLE